MAGITDLFGALAFLEMLSKGGDQPAPAPGPTVVPPFIPPPVPPPPFAPIPNVVFDQPPGPGPAPFKIPPPGVLPQFEQPPVPVPPPAPPGTLPPMPPWNQGITSPCPANLPPFPGPGWVPDTPVSDAVVARAQYWNPILWDYASKTIVHPSVCEQQGGRWLTFAAAWHPGDQGPQTYMATEAWRQVADQPMPVPVVPTPVVPTPFGPMPAPSPAPAPVPVVARTPLQAAAVAMASALNAHGYKQADQGLYRAFQAAAKTTADGFPGSGTMGLLHSALATMGLPMPRVPIYPWKSKPGTTGYDGFNAPTLQEWTGAAPPAPHVVVTPGQPIIEPAVTPAAGPPPPVEPYPGPGAWKSNAAYIARYQSALSYLSSVNPAFDPQGVDGKYGPHTAAAVKAFQAAHGLTQDGQAGPATAAALDAAMGVSAAA